MKKKYVYLIVIFLIVASFIVYGRILGNGFINYDDIQYITENNHIKSGINWESIKWALSSVELYYWQPLTWLSHMLDWSLFKGNAGGHHLISLLLHIGSVLLLFFFLNKTTKNLWPSAFAAALFALHPLRVESVAWAAERKDVLSMFFGLASIYAYACYAEDYKISRYILCLVLFTLSLMAKPMLVTLPFVLLLLDYWPLGRWQKALSPVEAPVASNEIAKKKQNKNRKVDYIKEKKIYESIKSSGHSISRLLWEKAPFIFLTIVSSIVTLWGQNKFGVVVSMENLPFSARVQNAVISYVSYLGKTFWPVNLAVFYPYEHSFPLWQILTSCLILIVITIVVIYAVKKLPFLFVGWLWYLGTLVPVNGLVQVAGQAKADRFTYLPSVGIAVMLAWGIPSLIKNEAIRKNILLPAGMFVLVILSALTWQECGYWKNSTTLFSRALQVTKDNFQAHNNFGLALFAEGKFEEAIFHYNEAIRLKPDSLPYYNKANAYNELGQYQRAIENYNQAIKMKPDYADAYNNRGIVYNKLNQQQFAIEDYNEAIRLQPDLAEPYNNRGNAYNYLGQNQRAIENYNKAIHLKPDYAEAYNNRGSAYNKLDRYQLALDDFNKAILLKPDFADAYSNRGAGYNKLGKYQLALDNFNKAIRLKPDFADAYSNRGFVYIKLGLQQLAIKDYNEAIRLRPNLAEAYFNRGNTYNYLGQNQQAIEYYNKAIRIKPDYADAYYNKGTAYSKLGQYQRAIEDFNEAISLRPDFADAYNNRGFAYLNQGNKINGCHDAKKACEFGQCKLLEIAKGRGNCR
jgi:tetratricopeptide (TPR) repeat protein